jgi:hypothetical protein
MANLVSPGVQVNVVDESVYGPAGAGTVPMIFVATGENKVDPTGTEVDGIAKYTKPENAGVPVLVTSQRELTQYFGNVNFRKISGTVVQGDETNEYGLLTAYSFLGQSSAAYVVRADVDLSALAPTPVAPAGNPANASYWLNPAKSNFGIFEYTAEGWVAQTPYVETVSVAGTATTPYDENGYLVELVNGGTETRIEYYVGNGGVWANLSTPGIFAPHYATPSNPDIGDVWVKTTQPGGGIDLDIHLFTESAGGFVAQPVNYVTTATGNIYQDGTGPVSASVDYLDGNILLVASDAGGSVTIRRWDDTLAGQEWDDIGTDSSVATGGYTMDTGTSAPEGEPEHGALWFDSSVSNLAIYEVKVDTGVQKWFRVTDVQYGSRAPLTKAAGGALAGGEYWIDTDEADYPVIYRYNGSAWIMKSNSDQSTDAGVVFADITANDTFPGLFENNLLADAPNPQVMPIGITAINMCRSGNTVRRYDATLTTDWKWRNYAGNAADGSGSFGSNAQRKVVTSAMQASTSNEQLREETVTFRLMAAPGYPEMYDEMVTLNSDRGETAFIIVDAPMDITPNEAVQWIQGTKAVENGKDGLVGKNTYSAAYYPAVLTTNPSTGDSVVAPPSHSVLYTMAYNDNVAYQWFAPAGLTRGVVQNASNVGYLNSEGDFTPVALNQGQRDFMYENKLNPIARFAAEGIVVFGQKTLSPVASALDRVNVARLTCYLRERFNVIARPYLFEPNDQSTRRNAKATFDGFMQGIQTLRGVYDFLTVCDTTNNTPARIDANELWIDVAIEPTKAAEFIYIPIRLVNTGEL